MRRRKFIALVGGAAAAWPLAARAQQSPESAAYWRPSAGYAYVFRATDSGICGGLAGLWVCRGKDRRIEWKWGQDRVDRLPDLAAELVGSQVDVIVTGGTPATKAVKNATHSIPIVMAMVGDPVGAALVESLGRPGGNATGLSIVATDLSGRRLQLLKEIVPRLSYVAVMSYGANPQSQIEVRETEIAARRLELQLHSVPISADTSIENAFDKIKKERVQALIVVTDPISSVREGRSWIWPREIDCRRCIPIGHFPREAA